MRRLLVGALLLSAAQVSYADPGNAWHLPEQGEPGIATMRSPRDPLAGEAVTVYTGNQYRGAGGAPGNQLQEGSAVVWRAAGGAWTEAPLLFHAEVGNNKYFAATFTPPAATIDYYFRIAYSDHATTFVCASKLPTHAGESEAACQSKPFSFTPVEFGTLPFALRYRQNGNWYPVPVDRVSVEKSAPRIRYRVKNWDGLSPEAVGIIGPLAAGERLFGFGERFDKVDQRGSRLDIIGLDQPAAKSRMPTKRCPGS